VDRFGSNSGYVDALYEQFISDPDSVSAAWREFFDGYQPEQDSRQKSDPEEAGLPTPEDVVDPSAASLASENTDASVGVSSEPRAPITVAGDPQGPPVSEAEDAAEVTLIPIEGVACRIVENMEQSTEVPTATTVRTIPVRLLEENRKIINEHQVAIDEGAENSPPVKSWISTSRR